MSNPPTALPNRLDARTRSMVVVLLFGAVLPLLDTTIVNVALDDLSQVFDARVSVVQWVATGYVLASAVTIPVSGWATHRYGGKRVWMTALSLFLIGSMACGLAWNIDSLIVFRIVQGIGGGLSMPILQTLLVQSAGKQQATRAMGAVGVPAVLAPILGPILGGLLLDSAGWRWIFFVNVPICLAGIVLAARRLPVSPADPDRKLDVTGLLLLSPGLALAVFGLSRIGGGNDHGWTTPAAIGAGAVLIAGFVVWAPRASTPLVDVRVFARTHFLGAWLSLLLTSLVFYGALLLLPLYYQRAWDYSPLQAGLVLALQGIGAFAARSVANRLTARIGTRVTVLAALALAAAGTLPFAVGADTDRGWLLGIGLVVRGAGVGAVTILTMGACYHRIEHTGIAHASTSGRIATQLGGALGSVVVATVLATGTTSHRAAGADLFTASFWWLVVLTACTALPALLLPRGEVERS
ncbi:MULTISPECIES: DHA2 family efflux MFS transporter permease subunit [unclassified Streptomyces]|uniref:DHA2 family efflux MFS transporter permease subunit n=1 Tax=unclassified Streptomyces TaxID=2593676 RepID=UPI000DB7B9EC|nr:MULTISPECIES: DHA2 family efflux MFS transporter permease subunit [unclassified Streptomyces]PZT78783.1 MFS transporter [Streptomyces sp. AC1-42T]